MDTRKKLAIVLFNLGGPDRPEAIKPFLLNLFRDPAILRVSFFIRRLLAYWITRVRLPTAIANYALIGGKSPLLTFTRDQARALETALPEFDTKCIIAMRYWHPMTDAAVIEVKNFQPDDILLLPLYPQYSTTTTASSLTAWHEGAARAGLAIRTTTLCCYPDDPGYIAAITACVHQTLQDARSSHPGQKTWKILFSAHGLPESIIASGDPYQHQITLSTQAILAALGEDLDWAICYQSRVTKVKWLSPSTEDEIRHAGQTNTGVIIVPIAFVSDHSETLVELDIEFLHIAQKSGVPAYYRVPVPNDFPPFITALANLTRDVLTRGPGLCAAIREKSCPRNHSQCPHLLANITS